MQRGQMVIVDLWQENVYKPKKEEVTIRFCLACNKNDEDYKKPDFNPKAIFDKSKVDYPNNVLFDITDLFGFPKVVRNSSYD